LDEVTDEQTDPVVSEALRALVDDRSTPVVVIGTGGDIHYANPAAAALLVGSDADTVRDRSAADLLVPTDTEDSLLGVLVDNEPGETLPLEVTPTEGDRVPVTATCTDCAGGWALTLRSSDERPPGAPAAEGDSGAPPDSAGTDTDAATGTDVGADTDADADTGDSTMLRGPGGASVESEARSGGVDVGGRVVGPFLSDVDWLRVLETATVGIAILDGEGRYRYVNPAHADVYGYEDPSTLVGETWRTLYDEAEADRIEAEAEPALEGRGEWRGEPVGRRRDGSVFPQDLTLSALPGDGLVCVVRDRSDAVEYRQTLEALQQATGDLLAADDPEAVAEVAVDAAVRALDLPLSAIFLHDVEADVLEPVAWSEAAAEALDDQPTFTGEEDSLAWDAFQSGETRRFDDPAETEGLYDPETPAGGEFILPLGDHGVMITGYLEEGSFDEESRRLARTLAASTTTAVERVTAAEALRDRNEQLERFSAMLSHDLRDPLNTAMATTTLARVSADGETVSYLDDLAEVHTRMVSLVEDVLALTVDGEGLDRTPTDFGPVVREAWETARRAAGATDATLTVEETGSIEADPPRLRRLVENLLGNAIHHGGESVHVRVGCSEEGFYVADDGPGIPPAKRESVFERGYSGDEGTGLGLDIVREVADAHGWSVTVGESEDGGARFDITTDR
jgi:PAS domain S-box-containing protein